MAGGELNTVAFNFQFRFVQDLLKRTDVGLFRFDWEVESVEKLCSGTEVVGWKVLLRFVRRASID